jgi:hypothetical protein
MNLFKKQRPASVLGLNLDGNRLEAIVLRRSGSSLHVNGSLAVPLALSPLGGDPLLVGREIRNHLDQAGIRERRCVLCLPASWLLTIQTQVPDLPEADIDSFLQLEAERGFTSGHESLYIVHSRSRTAGGEQYATLIAIPRNHLDTLEKALRAAQLKPLSFVLGMAALENGQKEGAAGAAAIALGSNSVELGGISGGGLVALRSLDGALDTTGPQKHLDSSLIARELRITLGQLPAAISQDIRSVKVFARGELARQFLGDFGPRVQAMGLRLETMDRASAAEFTETLPVELALSPALAAAANYVRAIASGPEILPPKVNPFQEWMAKRAFTKKLGWAGLTGAVAVLAVIGLFVFQQFEISGWTSTKARLDSETKEIKDAKTQIYRYDSWFDSSHPALNILKTLSTAFPVIGSQASAKSLRIATLSDVTCSGVAQSGGEVYNITDTLRKAAGVSPDSVKTISSSGTPPNVQFTINFQWEGLTSGE